MSIMLLQKGNAQCHQAGDLGGSPPLMDPPKVQHHMEQFSVTEIRNCQIIFQSTVHSAFPPAANESFGYPTSSSAFSLVLFSVLAILIDE